MCTDYRLQTTGLQAAPIFSFRSSCVMTKYTDDVNLGYGNASIDKVKFAIDLVDATQHLPRSVVTPPCYFGACTCSRMYALGSRVHTDSLLDASMARETEAAWRNDHNWSG